MECEFSNPVNYEGNPPLESEPFQFKNLTCNEGNLFTLIQNPETEAEFYIQKTMSYGDLILIIFLSIFLIFGIFKFLWNFIWSEFKRKI
jgi:hypothetical protein